MTNSQPSKPTVRGQLFGHSSSSYLQELSDGPRSGERLIEPPSLQNLWWRVVADKEEPFQLPTHANHQISERASMSALLNILDEVLLLTSNDDSRDFFKEMEPERE